MVNLFLVFKNLSEITVLEQIDVISMYIDMNNSTYKLIIGQIELVCQGTTIFMSNDFHSVIS